MKARGAFLHNVMPLISDPAHGTHYGLTGQRGPTAMELKALQDKLEGGAKLMRHCRQCRADAVGLLGEDRGQEFTLDLLPEEVAYDPSKREAYREVVAKRARRPCRGEERRDGRGQERAASTGACSSPSPPRAAAAINEHFGHATEFQVYEVGAKGIAFVGHRKVENYCHGGFGEDATLDGVIAALEGVMPCCAPRSAIAPGSN